MVFQLYLAAFYSKIIYSIPGKNMDTKSIKIPNILRAKVAVVGESTVGKTVICHQIASDGTDFPKNYVMTHISEVLVKSVKIPDTNECVELYLMDCSGKDVYNQMLRESWAQANLIVGVYDVTREETFGQVARWVEQVVQCINGSTGSDNKNSKVTGILVANKTDLEDRRIVSPKVGAELAAQLGLMYFECSAKDFKDVENPFYFLANEWHKIYQDSSEKLTNS